MTNLDSITSFTIDRYHAVYLTPGPFSATQREELSHPDSLSMSMERGWR